MFHLTRIKFLFPKFLRKLRGKILLAGKVESPQKKQPPSRIDFSQKNSFGTDWKEVTLRDVNPRLICQNGTGNWISREKDAARNEGGDGGERVKIQRGESAIGGSYAPIRDSSVRMELEIGSRGKGARQEGAR